MPPEIIECWLETEDGQRGSHIELEPSSDSIAVFQARVRNTSNERRSVRVRFFLDGEGYSYSGQRLSPGEEAVFSSTIEGESVVRRTGGSGPRADVTAEAMYNR